MYESTTPTSEGAAEDPRRVINLKKLLQSAFSHGRVSEKDLVLGHLCMGMHQPVVAPSREHAGSLWLPAFLPSLQAQRIQHQLHGDAMGQVLLQQAQQADLSKLDGWFKPAQDRGRAPKLLYFLSPSLQAPEIKLPEMQSAIDKDVDDVVDQADKAGRVWLGLSLYVKLPSPSGKASLSIADTAEKAAYAKLHRDNTAAFVAWLADQTPEVLKEVTSTVFSALLEGDIPPMERQAVLESEALVGYLKPHATAYAELWMKQAAPLLSQLGSNISAQLVKPGHVEVRNVGAAEASADVLELAVPDDPDTIRYAELKEKVKAVVVGGLTFTRDVTAMGTFGGGDLRRLEKGNMVSPWTLFMNHVRVGSLEAAAERLDCVVIDGVKFMKAVAPSQDAPLCAAAEVSYRREDPPDAGLTLELKDFRCGREPTLPILWEHLSRVVINGHTFHGKLQESHGT